MMIILISQLKENTDVSGFLIYKRSFVFNFFVDIRILNIIILFLKT